MVMAYKLEFKGNKGHRQVVKTIDIHEESYQALNDMVRSGVNAADGYSGFLVDDTYDIFGGNCYGSTVSMAVNVLIMDVVDKLEDNGMLSVGPETAKDRIIETVFPCMCHTNDESMYQELSFFNQDPEEVKSGVTRCLIKRQAVAFSENFNYAIGKDRRPAGEIALGILIYLSSTIPEPIDKDAN